MSAENDIIMYKLSKNKAQSYGYSEMYVIGRYEIDEDGFINVGEIIDVYDENRVVKVDPADFRTISRQGLEEGKKLFKKYGADVDIVTVFRATKKDEEYLYAIVGGKF